MSASGGIPAKRDGSFPSLRPFKNFVPLGLRRVFLEIVNERWVVAPVANFHAFFHIHLEAGLRNGLIDGDGNDLERSRQFDVGAGLVPDVITHRHRNRAAGGEVFVILIPLVGEGSCEWPIAIIELVHELVSLEYGKRSKPFVELMVAGDLGMSKISGEPD